jgi:hypothetical protein
VNQLRLFAPLRRRAGYPDNTMDLRIGGITYDLIVPVDTSDALVLHFLDSSGGYRRVARYRDDAGIDAVRADPTLLDDACRGVPCYADSVSGYETDDHVLTGYVSLRLAVSSLAAKQLYTRARARKSIDLRLADYVVRRDDYFRECGGFELLRILYYFDAEERVNVMRHLQRREPAAIFESFARRTRFRDVA